MGVCGSIHKSSNSTIQMLSETFQSIHKYKSNQFLSEAQQQEVAAVLTPHIKGLFSHLELCKIKLIDTALYLDNQIVRFILPATMPTRQLPLRQSFYL